MSYERRPAGAGAELVARTVKSSNARTRGEAVLEEAREDGAEVEQRDGKIEIRRRAKPKARTAK